MRWSQAREQRQSEYALEASASPAWISPELPDEQREVAEFHEQALGRLEEVCRRTYLMVREEDETYQCAALRLGAQPATVGAHVVTAERRLRREWRRAGSAHRRSVQLELVVETDRPRRAISETVKP